MNIFNREKFNDIAESVKKFIFDNKLYVIIFISLFTLILIMLMILLIIFSLKPKSDLQNNMQNTETVNNPIFIFANSSLNGLSSDNTKIDPNILRLLEEPLKLPPIQFSREQRRIWKKNEIDYWYKLPSAKSMEELNKKNKRIVDNILEAAP